MFESTVRSVVLLSSLGLCLACAGGTTGSATHDTALPAIEAPAAAQPPAKRGHPKRKAKPRKGGRASDGTEDPPSEARPEPEPPPAKEKRKPKAPKPAPPGISQESDSRWSVTERLVNQWKDDPYKLATVQQRGDGWELHGVRKRDAIHLGMRNKDVILEVNGKKLKSQAQMLAAYMALKNKTEFDVTFLRKGKRQSHHYSIK